MVDDIVTTEAAEGAKKTASQKIFEAAQELFYQRGVRAVGVDEIVSAAGVTKPSLYRAYRSKDELVVACLQEHFSEARKALAAAMLAAGEEPLDRLWALIHYFANKLDDCDFRGCAISNFAVELPDASHPGRAVLIECKSELRAIILDLVKQFDISDPEELADGIMLVMEGAFSMHHIFGYDRPTRSMLATCETLIDCHLLKHKA